MYDKHGHCNSDSMCKLKDDGDNKVYPKPDPIDSKAHKTDAAMVYNIVASSKEQGTQLISSNKGNSEHRQDMQ